MRRWNLRLVFAVAILGIQLGVGCARSRGGSVERQWVPDASVAPTRDASDRAQDAQTVTRDDATTRAGRDAGARPDAGDAVKADARFTDARESESESDSGAVGEPIAMNVPPELVELCMPFSAFVTRGNAELAERDRWASGVQLGQDAASAPNIDCASCALTGGCPPPSSVEGDCAALVGCVERHCLCRDCLAGSLPTGDFCGCVATCIVDPGDGCWSPWQEHLQCVASECDGVCRR